MSDSKLRELERRWRESGSVEHEAAYLLERLRSGALERERLELAAYLGDPASRRALGGEAPRRSSPDAGAPGGASRESPGSPDPVGSAVLAEWSAVLPSESLGVCTRVAVAACRAALKAHSPSSTVVSWASDVLELIEGWLAGPQTPAELEALAEYWSDHARNSPGLHAAEASVRSITRTARSALLLASYDPERAGPPPAAPEGLEAWRSEQADNRALLGDVLSEAQRALGARSAAVEVAVRAELVPWLLGRADPVRERVEARSRG